jgi:RNA polymerase sigma factor (sigma-70 family)
MIAVHSRSLVAWTVTFLLLALASGDLGRPSSGGFFCGAFQSTHVPSFGGFQRHHTAAADLLGGRLPQTALSTATSSPRSMRNTDDGPDKENNRGARDFLEDAKGHINPELAQRIFRWERDQRLNLKVRSGFSTREGLRWVQDLVTSTPRATNPAGSNDDLIQEGVMALMQAMTTYEVEARPTQSFENFAKERIQRALEDYQVTGRLASSTNSRKSALSVESTVEISDPLEKHYTNQDEWEVREGLMLDNGQGVKAHELVENFLVEARQFEGEDQMWIQQQQVAASLRDSIPSNEDDEANELENGDLSLDDLALRDMIIYNVDEFLGSTLDDLESQIIQLRFGLDADIPKTQRDVADDLDISVSKVRKLQKQALEKLRNAYSKQYVDEEDQYYHEDSV